jgi:hypothetical protein
MVQTRYHYMADFGFPGGITESGRIVAYNDHEAIRESAIVALGRKSQYGTSAISVRVRKVSPKTNEIIHTSTVFHA